MARPDFDLLDLPPDPPSAGEDVVVFYDCEFTDLTSDSDLLSIGFVAADVHSELYIEILDADVRLSSDFVRQEVLPLFGRHRPEVLTRDAAAVRIVAWLDDLRSGDRQRQVVMVSDSQWDWQHLLELFGAPMPCQQPWTQVVNVVGRMVQMMLGSGRQMGAFNEELERYHRRHGERHHALVDARALKSAYWESRFS
jgi:hypothetical protein